MIRNQINDIVKQLNAPPGYNQPGFLYGTAKELNALIDNAQFPVVMLYNLNPVPKKFTNSYAINSNYSIIMAFLFKTEFDQYTSQNEVYVDMANAMADEFLVRLSLYRETPYAPRYFRVNVDDPAKAQPVYNKGDINSTGITLQINLNTMFNTNVPHQ